MEMHRSIARAFSMALMILHPVAAAAFAIALVVVLFQEAGGGLPGFMRFLEVIGIAMLYCLIFGMISVVVRICQNLERLADAAEGAAPVMQGRDGSVYRECLEGSSARAQAVKVAAQ